MMKRRSKRLSWRIGKDLTTKTMAIVLHRLAPAGNVRKEKRYGPCWTSVTSSTELHIDGLDRSVIEVSEIDG
jgi:hypothetical protein